MKPKAPDAIPSSRPELRWLEPRENRFGIRVLDCQPFTRTMVSMTKDSSIAESFVASRTDDGSHLSAEGLLQSSSPDLTLAYPHDGAIPSGPVFKSPEMEVKWDIYCLAGTFMFCRSWTGDLIYAAEAEWDSAGFRITRILQSQSVSDDVDYVDRAVDFLFKSHLYGLPVPHPLRSVDPNDLHTLAALSFSDFGSRAWFGTFEDSSRLAVVHAALWDEPPSDNERY